jgi:hypothetical protein
MAEQFDLNPISRLWKKIFSILNEKLNEYIKLEKPWFKLLNMLNMREHSSICYS